MKKKEGFLLVEIIIGALATFTILIAAYGCYNTSIILMSEHNLREEAYILAQKEILLDSAENSLIFKDCFWVKRTTKKISNLNDLQVVTIEILNTDKNKVLVNLRKYE